mmetsp:Transcript_68545/g.185197  ORF Transcript_68545/g.185197 Transcript_68545/m.185197 type:complete len:204 (+) Transcript_68545:490-1101(+)
MLPPPSGRVRPFAPLRETGCCHPSVDGSLAVDALSDEFGRLDCSDMSVRCSSEAQVVPKYRSPKSPTPGLIEPSSAVSLSISLVMTCSFGNRAQTLWMPRGAAISVRRMILSSSTPRRLMSCSMARTAQEPVAKIGSISKTCRWAMSWGSFSYAMLEPLSPLRWMRILPSFMPRQQARNAFSIASPDLIIETPHIFRQNSTPW